GKSPQYLHCFIERDTPPGSHVEDSACNFGGKCGRRQEIARDHVIDVSEVTTLLAIPVDRGRLVAQHRRNEYCQNARILRGGILVRSEDIEVPERDGFKPVDPIKSC